MDIIQTIVEIPLFAFGLILCLLLAQMATDDFGLLHAVFTVVFFTIVWIVAATFLAVGGEKK